MYVCMYVCKQVCRQHRCNTADTACRRGPLDCLQKSAQTVKLNSILERHALSLLQDTYITICGCFRLHCRGAHRKLKQKP